MNVPDETIEVFVTVFAEPHTAEDVAPAMTCVEAEAMAEMLRALGAPGTAEQWIEAHAKGDEIGDMHG